MFRLSNLVLNPKNAKRHPIEMMFVGIFYTSISIFLGHWVFPEYSSIVMIFLTVISCMYVVQGAIILEEKKERGLNPEKKLMKQHIRTLNFLIFLFIGFLLAFTFWTIVLPEDISKEIFSFQEQAIQDIRSLTGKSISPENPFYLIMENNLRVLFFTIIFSIFYGAGAIFILVWNASILGFVMGSIAKYSLSLAHLPVIFLKYLSHGIPEMLAYFVAALAGGIIFVSILKGDFNGEKTKKILLDTGLLIIISICLLILAAIIEVYLSANI
ncbi:hypothetical protein COU60_02730 [Candidatus Pacearchaeota archaeon CG10_big_fil_rev_8_21_14_0_10_34_76]|nr:MAG: hypothetical protein COU60_02730 [Candidatus Pacearchaeota archaeon CG10_big_fil_rev_8_21_14_0_10_34_76]